MKVRPLTLADAEAIATWTYPGRESTYDVGAIVTAEQGIWAVEDSAEPDLVGKGSGRAFVEAILAFAMNEFSPQRLRLLILTWNERSRKVAESLGFQEEGIVPSIEGEFRVMNLHT